MTRASTAKKTPPASIEAIMARKKARELTVKIVLDAELIGPAEQAEQEAKRFESLADIAANNTKATPEMRAARVKEAKAARRKADKAKAEVEAATARFRFCAMGGEELEELLKAHRPTPAQQAAEQKEAKEQGRRPRDLWFNEETFPPAIIAACCADPEMSEEQAQELWTSKEWNDAERTALFTAAQQVNRMVDGP